MSVDEQFLDRAERSLAAVDILLDAGYVEIAASRTYYAAFYIASALFRARGVEFTRHSHLIAEFSRAFARNRELDPVFHWLLRSSFNLRARADYDPDPDIDRAEVVAFVAEAHRFLEAARAYLVANP